MAESFLEEQLKRIRELSEQVSKLRRSAVEYDNLRMLEDERNSRSNEEEPARPSPESARRRSR